MNKVKYFLIPVDDIERSIEFYRSNFGWEINSFEQIEGEQYYVIKSFAGEGGHKKPSIYGGLIKKGTRGLDNITVVVEVASIDETVKNLKNSELVFLKTPLKPSGFYAQVRDSEGNIIGLFEESTEV